MCLEALSRLKSIKSHKYFCLIWKHCTRIRPQPCTCVHLGQEDNLATMRLQASVTTARVSACHDLKGSHTHVLEHMHEIGQQKKLRITYFFPNTLIYDDRSSKNAVLYAGAGHDCTTDDAWRSHSTCAKATECHCAGQKGPELQASWKGCKGDYRAVTPVSHVLSMPIISDVGYMPRNFSRCCILREFARFVSLYKRICLRLVDLNAILGAPSKIF